MESGRSNETADAPPLEASYVRRLAHGVLSREPFWMSIVGNLRHPLRSRLEVKLAEVFAVGLALMQL
jgi:hypothetical protein